MIPPRLPLISPSSQSAQRWLSDLRAPRVRRTAASLILGLCILGCDSNPDGPRVMHRDVSEADAKPAPPAQPSLAKKGRSRPRALQDVKPD